MKPENADLVSPLPWQPALPWQPFCPLLVGGRVVLMLSPEYEVDVITHNGAMANFTCIHYMPV